MAIARKPNSKPKPPMDEAAADAFIAGAAKPEAAPVAAEADEAGQGAEPRKSPVMLRFDRAFWRRSMRRPSGAGSAAAHGFSSR
jgi:hypothetical protein